MDVIMREPMADRLAVFSLFKLLDWEALCWRLPDLCL